MSLTAYPTLRLKLTMPQALKLQFLPAIPGSNAAAAADRAEQAAQDAVDAANTAIAATANKVDRTGDVMSGFLTLNADPTTNLHAATKHYVDTHSGGGGTGVTDGDKGDITVSGTGTVWTIDNDAVTYAKIQNVSVTARFLGRVTSGAGDVEEVTGTQATVLLDTFTSTLKGLAPPSGGGTSAFLRADGSWVTPSGTGSGLSDAFQIITDGTTNSVAVGAGSFRLRTTAPLTVATQNNDPTFGDNALFALANGTALSVFGVTGNASAQRADIAGTVGQVLRVSGTTLAFGSIDLSVAATVGTSDLAFANLAQGTARSVLGVTGNATADVASIQGTADQVLRVNGAGTALAFGTVATAGITDNTVTYAKMQDVSAASLLLGRGSAAGAGDPQEITLGTNLSMSGTTLNATGGGGSGGLLDIQVFSTAGTTTYTPTSGMVSCIIEVVAGGGGGGGAAAVSGVVSAGGGGGSGGYSRTNKVAADIGASISITVGAAGTAASNAAGGNGGDSFVGASLGAALCAARGGTGGAKDTGAGLGQAGAGGITTGAVGKIIAGGSAGGWGGSVASGGLSNVGAGGGGSSCFGGGGKPAALPTAGAITGGAGTAAGAGGGGGITFNTGNAAGGAGAAGIIIITEYK